MTITKTIDIPANRRIILDIPQAFPVGKARISIFPAAEGIDIGEAEEASMDEVMASGREILAKHLPAFKALAK